MNAVTHLDQGTQALNAGREALDLKDTDLNDPETVIDGTGDGGTEGVSHETSEDGTKPTMGDSDEEKEQRSKSRETRMAEAGMTELQKVCADAILELSNFEKRRSEINAQMQAVRERLEAKGISKRSLAVAVMVSKMNEDHLEGFDTAYLICRKAIKLPVQSDMFNFKS